jgi:hypothetical protein
VYASSPGAFPSCPVFRDWAGGKVNFTAPVKVTLDAATLPESQG